jgi:hypothetical protein
MLIMLPVCLVQSLSSFIVVGNALSITDDDIQHTRQALYGLCCCCFNSSVDTSSSDESGDAAGADSVVNPMQPPLAEPPAAAVEEEEEEEGTCSVDTAIRDDGDGDGDGADGGGSVELKSMKSKSMRASVDNNDIIPPHSSDVELASMFPDPDAEMRYSENPLHS